MARKDMAAPSPSPQPVHGHRLRAAGGGGGQQRIPHNAMRRRIAEHMSNSLATEPHVTAMFEADFSAIIAHRAANRAAFERQEVALDLHRLHGLGLRSGDGGGADGQQPLA